MHGNTPGPTESASHGSDHGKSLLKKVLGQGNPKPVEKPVHEFERRDVMKGTGKGKEGLSEKIAVSAETKQEYKNDFKSHLKRLQVAVGKNPSLKNNENLQEDIALLDALKDDKGEISDANIEKFFSNAKGYVIATEATRRYRGLVRSSLGMDEGEFAVRQAAEKGLEGKVALFLYTHGGFLVGGSGRDLLFRHDVRNTRKEMFEAVKGDPKLKEAVEALTDIDLNSLEYNNKTGRIRKIPGETYASARSLDDVRREVINREKTIRRFEKDLHIDKGRFYIQPEDALFRKNLGRAGARFEGGLDFDTEVIRQFMADGGTAGSPKERISLYEKARQKVGLRYAQEYIHNELGGKNKEGESGVVEAVNARIAGLEKAKETGNTTPRGFEAQQRIDRLTAQKEELGITPEKQQIIAEFEAKRAALKEIEEKFDAERTPAEPRTVEFAPGYEAKDIPSQIENEIKEAEKEIGKVELKTGLEWNRHQALLNKEKKREELIKAGIKELVESDSYKALGPIDKDRKGWIQHHENVARVERAAARIADSEFDGIIEAWETQIKENKTKITNLKLLREQYRTAEKELVESEEKVINNAPKNLSKLENAYQEINDAHAIFYEDLRDLPIEKLYEKLKDRFDTIAPEELREKILLAKVEQKALEVEEYDKSHPAQALRFGQITADVSEFGIDLIIKPDDLLAMPEQQLLHLLSQEPYRAMFEGRDVKEVLRLAQAEARRKTRIRHKALQDVQEKDIDEEIKVQEKIIESEKNVDGQLETFGILQTLIARKPDINTGLPKIRNENEKFTDTTVVNRRTSGTEYSPVEKSVNAPKGYYEFLKLLFDYEKGRPAVREGENKDGAVIAPALTKDEYFKELYAKFSPTDLARILNEAFTLRVTGRATMDAVLPEFRTRLKNNTINEPDLYFGMKKAIDIIARDALNG